MQRMIRKYISVFNLYLSTMREMIETAELDSSLAINCTLYVFTDNPRTNLEERNSGKSFFKSSHVRDNTAINVHAR